MRLADIVTGRAFRPPRVIIYGPPGVGKTTFAAGAPQPIFIQCEEGADVVGAARFPVSTTYHDVSENIDALLAEKHEYKTVVIDSIDWLEPMVLHAVCTDNKWENIEAPGYGKGYTVADSYWRSLCTKLNALRDSGMVTILIGHSKIKRFVSPDQEPYDRYQIKVHDRAADILMEHADLVGFGNFRTSTKEVDVGFNRKVSRAIATGERVLYTQARPAFIAKSRYPMPDEINLVWSELQTALSPQKGE
jgi:DNA polymerase III delta prime subunit